MTSKSWLYMDKDSQPLPVVIVNVYYFGNFSVVNYMVVKEDGRLAPSQEVVVYNGRRPEFGINCEKTFPEIRTKYCYSCGILSSNENMKAFIVMDQSPMEEPEILEVFSLKEKAEEFVNYMSNLHSAPKENYPIIEREMDAKFKR